MKGYLGSKNAQLKDTHGSDGTGIGKKKKKNWCIKLPLCKDSEKGRTTCICNRCLKFLTTKGCHSMVEKYYYKFTFWQLLSFVRVVAHRDISICTEDRLGEES